MINCLFQLLRGHDDHVITCLEFCGSRVVSGSDDNTLKVWSVITGKVCNHGQTFSVAYLINSSSLIDKCTNVKLKYCKVHVIRLQEMSESFSGNLTSASRHLLQVDTKYTSGNKITPVLACKKITYSIILVLK